MVGLTDVYVDKVGKISTVWTIHSRSTNNGQLNWAYATLNKVRNLSLRSARTSVIDVNLLAPVLISQLIYGDLMVLSNSKFERHNILSCPPVRRVIHATESLPP